MHKKIREIKGLQVPRNLVYAVMTKVDPEGLEEEVLRKQSDSARRFFKRISSFHSIDLFCASTILNLISVWASQSTLVYGMHRPPTFFIVFFFFGYGTHGPHSYDTLFFRLWHSWATLIFFCLWHSWATLNFFFPAMALMGHTFFIGYGTHGPHSFFLYTFENKK